MSEVRELLESHEAAVVERIAKLRDELVPLERELFEIRLAKSAIDRSPRSSDQPELFAAGNANRGLDLAKFTALRNTLVHGSWSAPQSPYERFTIKELILKALDEQFEGGATAAELLKLFAGAWGRLDIARTSLSPQLSRLKQEGKLIREGQTWRLHRPHVLEEAAVDP
jgi:hypothetical protein